MTAAHTPLPWEAGTPGNGSPYAVYSDDATGSIIAMCQHSLVNRSHDEMVANAALIDRAVNSLPVIVAALETAKAALIKIRACSIEGAQIGYVSPQLWGDALFASHGDVATAIKAIELATAPVVS